VMARPPHPAEEPLLTAFVIWRTAFVGVLLLIGAGLLFFWYETDSAASLERSRTVAVNALVMGQIFYLFNARYFQASALTRDGLIGNRVVLLAVGVCGGLQLLLTYAPFMNTLFDTEPLGLRDWALCIVVGAAIFALVEIEKTAARAGRHPFVGSMRGGGDTFREREAA
jgi:magnesium-transporting ATPase (P-type)